MKVTQILEGVFNPSAGTSYSIARLADSLGRLGHDSQVLTLGPPPPEWPYEVPLRRFNDRFYRATMISPDFACEVRRLGATQHILHGHGVWRFSNVFPYFVARKSPVRLLVSPRGMLSAWSLDHKRHLKKPYWHLVQKAALRRVHCFHATSDAEARDLRTLGFETPIATIPNGIDMPAALERTPGRRILFLGRVTRVKGLDLLLPAWSRLAGAHPDWQLEIVGPVDPEYEEELRALLASMPLPRVDLPGAMHGERKAERLAAADLLVLPSYSENFGMVVAEALAHGVPVVTTLATPWHALAQKQCGWCVPPDAPSVEAALREALACSPMERRQMGARGREWMETDFAWPSIASRTAAVYAWLLGEGERPDCVSHG